jgi:hypothetical protein
MPQATTTRAGRRSSLTTPAGSPLKPRNERSYEYDVAAIVDSCDCNPFLVMAQIAMDLDLHGAPYSHTVIDKEGDEHTLEGYDPGLRLQAAKELAKYLAPQLKQIEHKEDPNAPRGRGLTLVFGGMTAPPWAEKVIDQQLEPTADEEGRSS